PSLASLRHRPDFRTRTRRCPEQRGGGTPFPSLTRGPACLAAAATIYRVCPCAGVCMLNVFTLSQGRLIQEEIDSLDGVLPAQPVWVDLEDPTPEEKGWLSERFGLVLPQDIIDDDIEESARFYEEDGAVHIRTDFLIDDDEAPRNIRVAFIL